MADDNNVILHPKTLVSNSDNYVLNGKIMLCSVTILSAAVLLMLCFHTYARWLFKRRTRGGRHHHPSASSIHHLPTTLTSDDISIPQQGLDLSILKALPTFVYLSETAAHPPPDCAVCLSEFKDGEKGRVLPNCRHAFHVECIDMWFYSHSNCPLCRAGMEPTGCSHAAAASLLLPLERERVMKQQPLDLDHLV